MKKVLLCQDIHPEGRKVLEGNVEVDVAPDHHEETIRSIIADYHGVIVRTATKLGAETIEAATNLEVIARTGAGVDNVDVEAATRCGIRVCFTPTANCTSVVEHALALLLALAKQVPLMDRSVREGQFQVRYDYHPVDVSGKVIGIVGLGKIGRDFAARCATALNMKVVGYDPYMEAGDAGPDIEVVADLGALFEQADFVSIHVPNTKDTHHLVNTDLIGRMKPSAYLINTARGPIVDENALATALAEKRIGGAALDVYEKEPPDSDNPLLNLPNVILTPHSAALTRECVARMAVGAAQGVLDVLQGREPKYVFNREALTVKQGH